jgi:hypothetical protein
MLSPLGIRKIKTLAKLPNMAPKIKKIAIHTGSGEPVDILNKIESSFPILETSGGVYAVHERPPYHPAVSLAVPLRGDADLSWSGHGLTLRTRWPPKGTARRGLTKAHQATIFGQRRFGNFRTWAKASDDGEAGLARYAGDTFTESAMQPAIEVDGRSEQAYLGEYRQDRYRGRSRWTCPRLRWCWPSSRTGATGWPCKKCWREIS